MERGHIVLDIITLILYAVDIIIPLRRSYT